MRHDEFNFKFFKGNGEHRWSEREAELFTDRQREQIGRAAEGAPIHEVCLPDGRRRRYCALSDFILKGRIKGVCLAAYGGGVVGGTILLPADEVPAAISVTVNSVGEPEEPPAILDSFKLSDRDFSLSRGEALLTRMRDNGALERLGDFDWRCLDESGNQNQNLPDFRKELGVADAPRIFLFANDEKFDAEEDETDNLGVFLTARNTLRAMRTSDALLSTQGAGTRKDFYQDDTLLPWYAAALCMSPDCPADWASRPCETWYEHMASMFERGLAASNPAVNMYLASEGGRLGLLAGGSTSSKEMLAHAREFIDSATDLRRIAATTSFQAGSITRDFCAAVPWEKISHMTVEDLALTMGANVHRHLHGKLPDAEVLPIMQYDWQNPQPEETVCRHLSDQKIWTQKPWQAAMLKTTLE